MRQALPTSLNVAMAVVPCATLRVVDNSVHCGSDLELELLEKQISSQHSVNKPGLAPKPVENVAPMSCFLMPPSWVIASTWDSCPIGTFEGEVPELELPQELDYMLKGNSYLLP